MIVVDLGSEQLFHSIDHFVAAREHAVDVVTRMLFRRFDNLPGVDAAVLGDSSEMNAE